MNTEHRTEAKNAQRIRSTYLAGADPGFPLGGGANPPGEGANIQIFPKTA